MSSSLERINTIFSLLTRVWVEGVELKHARAVLSVQRRWKQNGSAGSGRDEGACPAVAESHCPSAWGQADGTRTQPYLGPLSAAKHIK